MYVDPMTLTDLLPLTVLLLALYLCSALEQSDSIGISDETISETLNIIFK